MDALIGAPVAVQTQPTGGASASPLIPGQVVSARVVQALTADTFLLAVRGQALVARSPTPLPLDTVVQLAVRGGGIAGEPVSVRLLPDGNVQVPAASAPAAWSARAIAAQLGLPADPLSDQLVAACQRQGVPLRPAIVAPLLRLLQEAQHKRPTTGATEASAEASVSLAETASGTGPRSSPPASTSSLPALTTNPSAQLPAADGGREAVVGFKSGSMGVRPAAVVGAETGSVSPVEIHPSGRSGSQISKVPAAASAGFGPQSPLSVHGTSAPVKPGSASSLVPHLAVASSGSAQPAADPAESVPAESPTASLAVAARTAALTSNPGSASRLVPNAAAVSPSMAIAAAEAMTGTAPLPVTEPPWQTPENPRRLVLQSLSPRTWSSDAVRAMAAMPAETRTDAVVRLAASSLPPAAALLPLAAIAVRNDLPRTARFLPEGGASLAPPAAQVAAAAPLPPSMSIAGIVATRAPDPFVPTSGMTTAIPLRMPPTSDGPGRSASFPIQATADRQQGWEALPAVVPRLPALPCRDVVDLALGPDPRPAIRQGFALAGLVAGAPAGGETITAPPLERLLTSLLSRAIAPGPQGAGIAALAVGRSNVTASRTPIDDGPGLRHQASFPAPEEAPGAPVASSTESDRAAAHPAMGNDLIAIHEQVARDLLPPQELTEYERVLAVPLAIAGQPVPARLAVTTRCSGSGVQACWMRLDCELSRLGPVSVRLGGVEGVPVAITLVARPAAAAELAAALPYLSQDLHQLGVEAALRVVAEDEVPG